MHNHVLSLYIPTVGSVIGFTHGRRQKVVGVILRTGSQLDETVIVKQSLKMWHYVIFLPGVALYHDLKFITTWKLLNCYMSTIYMEQTKTCY